MILGVGDEKLSTPYSFLLIFSLCLCFRENSTGTATTWDSLEPFSPFKDVENLYLAVSRHCKGLPSWPPGPPFYGQDNHQETPAPRIVNVPQHTM